MKFSSHTMAQICGKVAGVTYSRRPLSPLTVCNYSHPNSQTNHFSGNRRRFYLLTTNRWRTLTPTTRLLWKALGDSYAETDSANTWAKDTRLFFFAHYIKAVEWRYLLNNLVTLPATTPPPIGYSIRVPRLEFVPLVGSPTTFRVRIHNDNSELVYYVVFRSRPRSRTTSKNHRPFDPGTGLQSSIAPNSFSTVNYTNLRPNSTYFIRAYFIPAAHV